jgi:PTS system nitrogen regulatory IIA component
MGARYNGTGLGETKGKRLRDMGLKLAAPIDTGNAPFDSGPARLSLRHMELRDFFAEDAVQLELQGTSKDEVLKELIGLLGLDEKAEGMLFKMLKRRENLGSTGIGRGIAIPHCRSLVVNRLRVAFGRKRDGVDFKAIDDKPVHFFFLIVAPPLEVSNQYLPVLGKIAQFSKEGDVPARLLSLASPAEFMALLEEKRV